MLPEALIRLTLPDFRKTFAYYIPQLIFRIFIKATGDHFTVKGDHAGMPEFPAMIAQFIFYRVSAVCLLAVTGIPVQGGDQLIAVLIIVHLGRFQFHFIHSHFPGELVYFFDLMLIGPYYQELKNNMGSAAF